MDWRRHSTHWALSRMSGSWKAEPLFIDDGTIRRAPEFSPDGKWLAYMSGPSNTVQDIYVEPFPRTGQVIRVTRNGGFWPFWSKKKGDRLFSDPSARPSATACGSWTSKQNQASASRTSP
jgi:Tol biopolymer transport system component